MTEDTCIHPSGPPQHLKILRIESCHSPVIPARRTFKVATLGQQLRRERTRPLGQRRVVSQPLQLGVRLVNPAIFEVALGKREPGRATVITTLADQPRQQLPHSIAPARPAPRLGGLQQDLAALIRVLLGLSIKSSRLINRRHHAETVPSLD
jgi:hypothetical protein